MIKIGDMFATELYYDNSKNNGVLLFVYNENGEGERFEFDLNTERFILEDEDDLTKEIIELWLEDHLEEIKLMYKNNDFRYIKDLRF